MSLRWIVVLLVAVAGCSSPPASDRAAGHTGADAVGPAPQEHPADDPHAPLPRPGSVEAPPPLKAGEPINDRATYRFLAGQGEKLVRAGRTLTDWVGRLDRRSCQLKRPSPSRRRLSVAEIARRAEPAVAIVGTFYHCEKCSRLHMATAAGFFLNESGALATCRHVLATHNDHGRGVVVLTRDGRLCPVRGILAADPVNDLLILQVEGQGFTPLPLSDQAPPGSPVTVVSHPQNRFYLVTTGVVARHATQQRRGRTVDWIAITADFARGSSGAPVCNESGAVVALVNNTESIYYSTDNGEQKNLQMVVKNCTPAAALMRMILLK